VVFCSTVEHAQNVAAAFRAHGITATTVHGEMSDAERKATLGAYAKGRIQVITNVAVLTEGWDHPPTSCVVLLRPSSYKSTMIQMVGRGLRTVNPEEYPGVVKTDCIILDFGTSSLIHGSLEQDVDHRQPGPQAGHQPRHRVEAGRERRIRLIPEQPGCSLAAHGECAAVDRHDAVARHVG
jgi:superfamily II DNA or RNA helicase